MKIFSKVAATALLVFTFFPAVASGAQTCVRADYCNPETPDVGGSDSGTTSGDAGQPGGVGAGGPRADAGDDTARGEGTEVLGAESEAPATAGAEAESATAPSGALPITGGDVVGIAVLGAAAVALGAVLVKRSRAISQLA